MPKSYLGLIWQSFMRLHGLLLSLAGIGLTFLVWLLKPGVLVPVTALVPAALTAAILFAVLIDAGHTAWQARRSGLPSVMYASPSIPGIPAVQLVCLLEPSDLFSYGVQVGFYYKNPDGFELLIGLGHVVNIQDDKRVQVGLTRAVPGQEAVVGEIGENARSTLERVRVKPSVPHDVFGVYFGKESEK